jgi:hypothetical protein
LSIQACLPAAGSPAYIEPIMYSKGDEPNVTIGRQGWTTEPTAQMLGAGTSNAASFSEVGLSANPAAMHHGLEANSPPAARDSSHQQQQQQHTVSLQGLQSKGLGSPGPMQQQQQLHPAGATSSAAAVTTNAPIRVLQPQIIAPVPAAIATVSSVTTSTPIVSSMQRSVSTAIAQQRRRMAPTVHRRQQEEAAAAQQQGDTTTTTSSSSGGGGNGDAVPVGTPIVVQPGATQVRSPGPTFL